MRGRSAAPVVGLTFLVVGCLFETTPPKRQGPPNEPPGNPNAAVVTGLVQLRDRADGRLSTAPGWTVLVNWYRRDTTGDGQPDIVGNAVIPADHAGVYHASNTASDIVRVAVAARLCTLPEIPACCLEEFPCNVPQCTALWTVLRPRDVTPGAQVQQNLVVNCP